MNLFKNSWHTLVKTALGILLISALAQQAAFAQFRVEVSGVGLTRIPIAFAQFRDEGLSPQPISKIVGSDLERSGQFRAIGTHELVDETQIPDLAMLRQSGADAFVAGSVAKLANGQFEVRFRLCGIPPNQ